MMRAAKADNFRIMSLGRVCSTHFSRGKRLKYSMCKQKILLLLLVTTWLINICLSGVHIQLILFQSSEASEPAIPVYERWVLANLEKVKVSFSEKQTL